jgi:hypothetical protein
MCGTFRVWWLVVLLDDIIIAHGGSNHNTQFDVFSFKVLTGQEVYQKSAIDNGWNRVI